MPDMHSGMCAICLIAVALLPTACISANMSQIQQQGSDKSMQTFKIDFSYAFALPHRITVALPDSSNKTLIDVNKDNISLGWTYNNLLNVPLDAHQPVVSNWWASCWPEIDGRRLGTGSYSRLNGYLPALHNVYQDNDGVVDVQIVGGKIAAIARIEVRNTTDKPHKFDFVFTVNGAFGEVPGYVINGDPLDYVTAGWNGRADQILAMGVGANCTRHTRNSIDLQWNLEPGKTAVGWVVRPYKAYESDEDAPKLRSHDWAKEFDSAKATWTKLLGRAFALEIPDESIRNAYYAGLADIFIMREPVANGYIAACPGTEGYRCPNDTEPLVGTIGIDQSGLHKEAELGYLMCLDQQGKDGNWATPWGWTHRYWSSSGFKAWSVIEHYKLTGNKAFLEKYYPRLLACSQWQEGMRAKTRVLENGRKPLTYGLMPRGAGDCGLDAGDSWYGVFYPHNIWALYADKIALEAGEILGKEKDIPTLRHNYEVARDDLLESIRNGSIQQEDYKWIPGSPARATGSRWGVLNAAFPTELLSANDPLITGTLRFMNTRVGPGGLQLGTGYMADGMWVAISLDNVAEVELMRNNGDEFARLLYACINHGTPLYTWCEERGKEAGTSETGGDRQHLWTPTAIIRGIRDAMVMEEGDGLHMARGTARQWLGSGESVGIKNVPTHFGYISYELKYESKASRVAGEVNFPAKSTMRWAVLHVRLPEGLIIKSSNTAGAEIIDNGEGIKWLNPKGKVNIDLIVGSK